MPCPVITGPVQGTTTLTMGTQAMFARTGWITRLPIWRGRGMGPASTAGSLRLRYKDSASALLIGKLLQPHWWAFLLSRGNQILDMETLILRLIKPMVLILTLRLIKLMLILTPRQSKQTPMLTPRLTKQMPMLNPKLIKKMEVTQMIPPR